MTKNQKFPKGIVWRKKFGKNGDGWRRSNFGLKLSVHIQYNILSQIWPAPVT